ncbi:MAG: 4Fe-4S binding protein [Oscillospiraceae bacterium]|nr:4Fe-4S binding protein [Oscillospiraceae bacterium]
MPKMLRSIEMNKCLGCFTCMNVCASFNHKNHSLVKSAIRIRTTGGMASNFICIVCLACAKPACMEPCPSNALVKRDGGGVLLTKEKCIGCRLCEKACIVSAVNFDEEHNHPIICHHCGICTRFCPHDCLQLIDSNH